VIDYPWLQPIAGQLLRQLERQQLHHALLLHGPDGLGKQALARQLAAALLCKQPASAGACGHCHGCQLQQVGNHPDFYEARVADAKSITVDRIRHVSRQLAGHSQLGGNKVVLVQPADAMNEAAANALLKTLEEPASGSYLLLLTERLRQLPATIVSRCQAVRFSPPAEARVVDWLHSQLHAGLDLRAALRINQGAPLSTLRYFREDGEAHRLALVSAMAAPGSLDKLSLAQCYMTRPQDSARVVQHLLLDAIKCHQGIAPESWSHCDQVQAIQRFASRFTLLQLFDGQQALLPMIDLIASQPGINGELQVFDWLVTLLGHAAD